MNFIKYMAKRIIAVIPVLLGISFLSFFLGYIAPGDVVDNMNSEVDIVLMDDATMEAIRDRIGVNQPMMTQYKNWLKKAIRGDLGESYLTGRDIFTDIVGRIPITLKLAGITMLMITVFGILIGYLRVRFKETRLDNFLGGLMICNISIPSFWISMILLIVFSEVLRIFPTSGLESWKSYILPCTVLSFGGIGNLSRLIRSSWIDELGKPYIFTAKSLGASTNQLLVSHALPNSLNVIVTYLGQRLGGILGGATIVENIFGIRGLGNYVLGGIGSRDYPIVQGYVLFIGFTYVLINLCVDLISFLIQPKMRLRGKIK